MTQLVPPNRSSYTLETYCFRVFPGEGRGGVTASVDDSVDDSHDITRMLQG